MILIGASSGRYATQKEAMVTPVNQVMHATPRDLRIFRSEYPTRKNITRARIRIAHSCIVVSLTSPPQVEAAFAPLLGGRRQQRQGRELSAALFHIPAFNPRYEFLQITGRKQIDMGVDKRRRTTQPR